MTAKGVNCLLVKTSSEIALKSDHVRRYFTKKLVSNIKLSLKANNISLEKIARGAGRLYLFTPDIKKTALVLQNIVGVHGITFATRHKWKEYSVMEEAVLLQAKKNLKKGDSFAIRARREPKVPITSKDIEIKLGAAVMGTIPGLSVKLKGPDKEIFVEARERDFFLYWKDIPCFRGLPLGVEGNAAFLFEGKKNELLAAFLLMCRGCNIYPLVEKKSKAIEKHVNNLKKFNSYRDFVFTELSDIDYLIEKREVQALGTADESVADADLEKYAKSDAAQKLVVLRPLLLYPDSLKKIKPSFGGKSNL